MADYYAELNVFSTDGCAHRQYSLHLAHTDRGQDESARAADLISREGSPFSVLTGSTSSNFRDARNVTSFLVCDPSSYGL